MSFAYLFGSRVTGRHRPDSDADIAIMPGEALDLLTEADLADRLTQALEVPTVDLVDLRRAPLRVRGRVLAELTFRRGSAASARGVASGTTACPAAARQ